MKEIRDKLRALKVDFSHCIEKAELKALLKIHMPGVEGERKGVGQ